MTSQFRGIVAACAITVALTQALSAEEGSKKNPGEKGVVSRGNVFTFTREVDEQYLTWSLLTDVAPKKGVRFPAHEPLICWNIAFGRVWSADDSLTGNGIIDHLQCYRLGDLLKGKLLQGPDSSPAEARNLTC